MKKITLLALLFTLSWQTHAQNFEDPNAKRNELKFDVAHTLYPAIKIEYERFLNEWSSFGVVGLKNFSKDEEGYPINSMLLGTYRLYFARNHNRGFFAEGNLGFISGTYYRQTGSWWIFKIGEHIPYSAFGAGITLGWKWHIPQPNIVLDLFTGIGRLFHDEAGFYQRFGVCVGKRF